MLAARLDRRVRSEAQALVREATAALRGKAALRGNAGALEAAAAEVSAGLAATDYRRVRLGLPALDALVDELVKPVHKSLVREYAEAIAVAVLIAVALREVVLAAFEIPSSSMYPTVEINDHVFVNKLGYGLQVPFTADKLISWSTPQRGDVIVFIMPCEPDRDYIKRVIATAGQTVEVRCNVVYVDGQPIENRLVQGAGCSYEDRPEGQTQWTPRECSEYVERVPGHEYHTYHDPGRPLRDADVARTGSLEAADPHDFIQLSGMHFPPGCNMQPDGTLLVPTTQKRGRVVATRDHAGPCELQMHYVVPEGHLFAMGDNRSNSRDSRSWGAVPVENVRGKALFIWLSFRTWNPFGGIRWNRMGSFVE